MGKEDGCSSLVTSLDVPIEQKLKLDRVSSMEVEVEVKLAFFSYYVLAE